MPLNANWPIQTKYLCPHRCWHSVVKMVSEDDLLVASCAVILIENENKIRKQRKRRFWVRPSLQSRARYIK